MSLDQLSAHKLGNVERSGIPTDKLADVMIGESANVSARAIGQEKNNLDRALKDFDKAKFAIYTASDELHEKMEIHSRKSKEAVARAKDACAQMTDAMNKVTKVLGPDFEKRLDQLQQLTDCMERLSQLNQSGKLAGVLEVLRKT